MKRSPQLDSILQELISNEKLTAGALYVFGMKIRRVPYGALPAKCPGRIETGACSCPQSSLEQRLCLVFSNTSLSFLPLSDLLPASSLLHAEYHLCPLFGLSAATRYSHAISEIDDYLSQHPSVKASYAVGAAERALSTAWKK